MAREMDLSELPYGIIESFKRCKEKTLRSNLSDLIVDVDEYFLEVEKSAKSNPMINMKLVTAIHKRIKDVESIWSEIDIEAKSWFSAAFQYFIDDDDDDPDLDSYVGFEDDAEVLNVCLVFAEKDDWTIAVEEHDD